MTDEKKTAPYFIDKSGREVRVGDFVVYGHNLGRCAGLRFGRILKIETCKNPYRDETEWRIGVRGIDDDWDKDLNDIKPANRGVLLFPQRILCVNNIIPENYIEALKKADEVKDD